MGRRDLLTLLVALIGPLVWPAAYPVEATTVIPPTFEQLVSAAESIVVAEVVDVRSVWEEGRDGRAIVTQVTFRVERTLKGRAALVLMLEFLGGTVGDVELRVAGMPQFHAGDRDLLFMEESGRPASAVVAVMHGRFRITVDDATGGDVALTYAGLPFSTPRALGPAFTAAAGTRPMRLADFEAEIAREVRAQAGRQ